VSFFESKEGKGRESHFEEECQATLALAPNTCWIRVTYESLSLGEEQCLEVRKGTRPSGRLCGNHQGLQSLVPVGNSVEEVVVATSPTNSISPASPRSYTSASPSTWRIKIKQEKCPPATSRLLVLSTGPGKTCGVAASRTKRSSSTFARRAAMPKPNTMLEIAGYRVKDTVASEFFQVVTASSLQLSALSRGDLSAGKEEEEEDEGRRRKRQRRRRRKLASLFASPSLPPWMGKLERQGKGCPAYLVSSSSVLVPAPCLLQGITDLDAITFILGPHSRQIKSLLLHPSREVHDLALLQISSPLPSSRRPACLSPITSKYSTLFSEEGASHAVKTVNRRKCGKLGREEVCVSLEGRLPPRAGDPVVRNLDIEGFYSRRATAKYHVITDLFQMQLWIKAANNTVP